MVFGNLVFILGSFYYQITIALPMFGIRKWLERIHS